MGSHLLVFDLYSTGHHSSYVEWIVDRWLARGARGRLTVALPDVFETEHPALIEKILAHSDQGLSLRLFDRSDRGKNTASLLGDDREHGRVLRTLIPEINPDHVLLMYFDRVQISLATTLRFRRQVSISGIYFRPSFHYHTLGSPPRSAGESIRRWQKKALLRLALRNPHLDTLFSLDPFVVRELKKLNTKVRFLALPEAGPSVQPRSQTRPADTGRLTLVLFGVLSRIKGVLATLESVRFLPEEVAGKLRIRFAGPLSGDISGEVTGLVREIRNSGLLEIDLDDRFLATEEIQPLLSAADVILIPYQHHIGMSHVLVRAAATGVPVLGPDYGLVGELIRRHRLGRAIDSTNPEQIAAAMTDMVLNRNFGFDPEAAANFARSNTVERFAKTILDQCLDPVRSAL